MEELIVAIAIVLLGAIFERVKLLFKNADKRLQGKSDSFSSEAVKAFPKSDIGLEIRMPQLVEPEDCDNVCRESVDFDGESAKPTPTVAVATLSISDADTSDRNTSQMSAVKEDIDTDKAVAEHYEHWRRAIIYSEILVPKFKD